ncbi:hypothetical protein RIF29_16562 [Crotalaria pallida]|uniref:Uncharacterized protein n=1 Tax=Crotalaria pallida TaxID=3830 RepID=A0AAN9FLC0_CROPI
MGEVEVDAATMKKKKKNGDCSEEEEEEEVVRWERILPAMVLRVLLIEPDHSTRHVISALLRKCSYKVTAVPDGLKAWETLKRKAPDLDLILTEVQLPAISGFALLTLIMEHDFCKNIPVIMMSSHDSVSMVLKCMSKGAADFLIKPVRRNELGNLWQHVWRRHAIKRPPQNSKSQQEKLKTASEDNYASSNQSSGFVASSQKNNEWSEILSQAQSTCTSPFPETESAYMENMQDGAHLKSSSKLNIIDAVKLEESTKFESESARHDDGTGEESITFVLEAANGKTFKSTDSRLEQDRVCTDLENKDEVIGAKLSCKELVEASTGAINLIGTFDNLPKHADENCRLSGGNTTKFDCDTRLELSLRCSPGSSCKQASEASEERQRLNHSNTSPFSWYSGSNLLQPFFPSKSITSAELKNNTDWDSHKSHKISVNTVDSCCQYGSTNQNQENMTTMAIGQIGHVGTKLSNSPCGIFTDNGVASDLRSKGVDNVLTSVSGAQSDVHSICNPKPCKIESSPFPTGNSSQSNAEIHNSEQQYHQYEDTTDTSLVKNEHDNSNLDHAALDSPAASQSAGNSLCRDAANHINSAYGSIGSGSDGNTTSSVITKNNPEIFSDSSCHDYDGFRGTKSHCSSQRKAALEKFRLKRKERCYEKKVRYQSRKRLAEQRPRVKGQFVRQVHNDHPVTDASVDS